MHLLYACTFWPFPLIIKSVFLSSFPESKMPRISGSITSHHMILRWGELDRAVGELGFQVTRNCASQPPTFSSTTRSFGYIHRHAESSHSTTIIHKICNQHANTASFRRYVLPVCFALYLPYQSVPMRRTRWLWHIISDHLHGLDYSMFLYLPTYTKLTPLLGAFIGTSLIAAFVGL